MVLLSYGRMSVLLLVGWLFFLAGFFAAAVGFGGGGGFGGLFVNRIVVVSIFFCFVVFVLFVCFVEVFMNVGWMPWR